MTDLTALAERDVLRGLAESLARRLLDAVSFQVRHCLVITMPNGEVQFGGTSNLVQNCHFLRWNRLSAALQNELIREGVVVAAMRDSGPIIGAATREAVRDALAYKLALRARAGDAA